MLRTTFCNFALGTHVLGVLRFALLLARRFLRCPLKLGPNRLEVLLSHLVFAARRIACLSFGARIALRSFRARLILLALALALGTNVTAKVYSRELGALWQRWRLNLTDALPESPGGFSDEAKLGNVSSLKARAGRTVALRAEAARSPGYLRGRAFFPDARLSRSFKLVGMMAIVQIGLGIATLLLQVPVLLGALHQAGALLLLGALLYNMHALSRV